MWFFVGVVSSAFQVRHAMTSWMARRTLGIFAAFGATGLTWAAIILEGNARKMYLDEMQDKVLKEEKAFYS